MKKFNTNLNQYLDAIPSDLPEEQLLSYLYAGLPEDERDAPLTLAHVTRSGLEELLSFCQKEEREE